MTVIYHRHGSDGTTLYQVLPGRDTSEIFWVTAQKLINLPGGAEALAAYNFRLGR